MINENSEEEKSFYNKIGSIIGWDFSKIKYEMIDNSKFHYFDEINKYVSNEKIILDIGTGGGEKLSNLISNDCLLKIGTDFSEEMIKNANKNNHYTNIKFFEMNSESIKFPDAFFDIICARHTPFNIKEVDRLLKKGGVFFSEQIDEDDCKELKEIFERGQGYNVSEKLVDRIKKETSEIDADSIEFFDIIQEEYYKEDEDLLFLLKNTLIIPNFGEESSDFIKFNKYVEKNKNKKGIFLNRRLFGLKIIK